MEQGGGRRSAGRFKRHKRSCSRAWSDLEMSGEAVCDDGFCLWGNLRFGETTALT